MSTSVNWGCCSQEKADKNERAISCTGCKKSYHFLCLSITEIASDTEVYHQWNCPSCTNRFPKTSKKDSTPVRNVSTTRGNKRPALNSPPEEPTITSDKLRAIVEDVVKTELNAMLKKLNSNIVDIINKELAPIRKEIGDMNEYMSFINGKFESIEAEQLSAKKSFKDIVEENKKMENTILDLTQRLNYLEQKSRSNNLEFQCVPEVKSENLYTLAKNLASVVGYDLNDRDILHCTRVAKLNKTSTRPKSIIIQLSSPRIRDELLASVINFNKTHANNKLNANHLGFLNCNGPIYVAEHLSPTIKALHAATRLKAKERGYRYTWVRNGRIFVRKSDDAEHIFIRNLDTLKKLI